MRLVFLDTSTVTREGDVSLAGLQALGEWAEYPLTLSSETLERVQDADVVISNKVVMNRETIERSAEGALKLVCVAATGTNNVDLEAAKASGVQVCNVSGYSTKSVAQHTLTMMLNLVTQMHRYVREPQVWAESPIFTRLDYPVRDLDGMRLGLVGVGNIGARVGELAEAMGMHVQALGRAGSTPRLHPEWPRLEADALFETSDVISLHCPLTPGTHHFINGESLGKMKPGGYLINTGRGELVEEQALLEALRSGQLAGAGLDVLSVEPPSVDHPLLAAAADLPQLLITPHNAWSSARTRQGLVDAVAANIEAFQRSGEAGNRLV